MKKRNAFTLIELLVVIAILGVCAALIIPAITAIMRGPSWYDTKNTIVARITSTYVMGDNPRVTIQKAGNVDDLSTLKDSGGLVAESTVIVLSNDNDSRINKYNSETIQANLQSEQWYVIETVGYLKESANLYPNIVSATHLPAPEVKAEIQY